MPDRTLGSKIAVVALATTLGAACGRDAGSPRPDETPVRGGAAVIGSISDVDSWNELTSRQSFANNLHRRIFLRLVREKGDSRDHPPSYEPLLAESWSLSPDGLALTFRLREATWSDGRPLTASDVRFTWKAQIAPEVAWVGAKGKALIVDVEARDPRTVVFRFARAYADSFADAVEGGILPEHVFGSIPFPEWPTHDWSSARVGSGPFVLESWKPGEEIVLARNRRYFDPQAPLLDRVVVRIVPDATSLLTQLLAGTVDYVDGISPREAARVGAAPGARLLAYDVPMYDYVGWNATRPPLDDPEVRRALTLAIDRRAIVEDLLYGYGRVSSGPLLSFWWGHDPEAAPLPYEPDEARRILAEKGFLPGRDGTLERGGKRLDLELTTNAGNRLREAVAVKVQEQLGRIGVRVRTGSLEMQTFVHRNTSGAFDAYIGGWRFSGKVELQSVFGSSGIPPGGNNVVRYRSTEVDRALEDLGRAPDWRAMKPLLAAISRRIVADQPYTFLYETQRLAAAGPRLSGVEIDVPSDPLSRLERWSVHE